MTNNRVRELRLGRRMSQDVLAKRARLSRQTIFAMESGRSVPGVDVALRIAAALECTVEALFGAPLAEAHVMAVPALPRATGRVHLAQVSGAWVSQPVGREGYGGAADGLVRRASGRRVDVELLAPLDECRENFVISGCAGALGVLAGRLNARTGPGRFVWLRSGSTGALDALARQEVHVAGVHLVDGKTGEANVPDVRRRVRKRPVTLITLGRWEMGLLVPRGNPKKIRSTADAGHRSVRVALREPGSGARRLWEREARRAELSGTGGAHAVQTFGHAEVASAVAMNVADVGVATRDVALAYGLDFVPIAEERYDLVVPTAELSDPRVVRLLDAVTSGSLRKELTLLGYEMNCAGERVAELPAA